MDVRTISLLLLSGIRITVPFQNLTITFVIWDQLVRCKRINVLCCCSILLMRSTNWATAISMDHFSHCFPLLTSCAFPSGSSEGICWVSLQKFSECTAMNKSNCLLKPFFDLLKLTVVVFPFTNQFLYLHTSSISCNFFLESLSSWLQSVLMPPPLEQHRITAIEFPVR